MCNISMLLSESEENILKIVQVDKLAICVTFLQTVKER